MKRKMIIVLCIIGTILIVFVRVWHGEGNNTKTERANRVDESTIEPANQKLTATEALETFAGESSISGAKYFANETWVVGVANSSSSGEAYIIVAKYSGSEWSTVDVGTFIDTELLLLDGAPPDVIAYLEEIQ